VQFNAAFPAFNNSHKAYDRKIFVSTLRRSFRTCCCTVSLLSDLTPLSDCFRGPNNWKSITSLQIHTAYKFSSSWRSSLSSNNKNSELRWLGRTRGKIIMTVLCCILRVHSCTKVCQILSTLLVSELSLRPVDFGLVFCMYLHVFLSEYGHFFLGYFSWFLWIW